MPQPPQWATLVVMSTQPPAQQTLPFLQAVPQAPQFAPADCVSTHACAQHSMVPPSPGAQLAVSLQPLLQEVTSQYWSAAQLSCAGRHATHRPLETSQRGAAGAAYSAPPMQPRQIPRSTSQRPASMAHVACCAVQPG